MGPNTISVFQSGEPVHTNGVYRVIGVDLASDHYRQEHAQREFRQGDCFPNYEGCAVCWLLVEITFASLNEVNQMRNDDNDR